MCIYVSYVLKPEVILVTKNVKRVSKVALFFQMSVIKKKKKKKVLFKKIMFFYYNKGKQEQAVPLRSLKFSNWILSLKLEFFTLN